MKNAIRNCGVKIMAAIAAVALATYAYGAPPANDNFANATVITGTEGVLTASNVGATTEASEPLSLLEPGMNVHSVWYKWTAPSGVNRVAFYTYAEQLAGCFLFSGMDLNNLTFVAGETTTDDCFWSLYRPQYIVPGGTYYICVASADGIENLQFGWKATKPNEFDPIVVDGLMIGTIGDGCPANFTIPNTVTWIACAAFDGGDDLGSAKKLESVVIPESVAGIDGYAFQKCVNLSSVTFNKGMYVIKDFAFSRCSSLGGKTLNLPWMLKEVTGDAFAYIGGVVNVEAPRYVESQLFSGFYNETTLNVKYFDYTVNDRVNVILHPEGGEFSKGLSLAGRIRDDESTIVEVWKNQADWNNAISRKPRKEGYVFDGFWTEPSGGKQIWDADMKYVSGTGYWSTDGKWTSSVLFGMDAYAHWKEAVATYKVTLGKNGGTGGDSYVTATYGSAMPMPCTAPTLDGWTFAGYWDSVALDANGNPKGKQYYDASMKSVRAWDKTSATTLWAKWTNKVTLGKNGGTGGDSYVTCTKGQPMPKRTMPTKSGYVFDGYWTSTGAGGVKYYNADGTSARAWDKGGSVTLWAKWVAAVSCKVTFGKNGGTGGDNYVTATTGKPMPTPRTAPTLKGWSFGGYWDTLACDEKGNPKGKQYYNSKMESVRAWDKTTATTLWAKWTVKVTLGKNGGTGGDSAVTVIKGQPFPKRTMPTKSGYTFGGYFVSASSKTGQCYNPDGTGTASMKWSTGGTPTIWALWTKTSACIELPPAVARRAATVAPTAAPSASAAPETAPQSAVSAGIYSGVLADGSGAFWLMLDEAEKDAPRTAYIYIASEDGALTAECTVEESDGILVLTTEDGETFAVDPAAGSATLL